MGSLRELEVAGRAPHRRSASTLSILLTLAFAAACAHGNRKSDTLVRLDACDTVSKVRGPAPAAMPALRPTSAATGAVVGTAADRATGAAIGGVNVRLLGRVSYVLVSDSSGRFQAADLRPGLYSVVVTRIGFEAIQDSVSVLPNAVDTLRYSLQYRSCP